jgi:cyanophycinase
MAKGNKPKGKLIPIGGNESRSPEQSREDGHAFFGDKGILSLVLEEMKGKDSRIGILPTASQEPEEICEMYLKAFKELGCKHISILDLDGRNVNSKEKLHILSTLDGILISGGDQNRLKEKLEGSEFLVALKDRYFNSNFVIAGTSAGAMAMAATMIQEGESDESLLKGTVELTQGFGFLAGAIIDTHFMARGRFARLTEALLAQQDFTAIGICEDTGLVITDGNLLRTIGSGVVLILQANQVKATNFKTAKKGSPIYVEGLSIHILAKGAEYSLADQRFTVIK